MLLPAECLDLLKCSLCKRLLSRFPVYVTKDDNNQLLSICGRCQVPSDDNYLRVTIYESVMKNIQFPCINRQNGCMEYLIPENIEQHELLCQYQSIKCKICEWSGQFFTVLDHYQSKHADQILKNYKFEMNVKEDSNSSNILLHKETIFSFDCNFDQNLKRIKCTLTPLFSTKSVKKYYAQINLIIDDITLSKRFPAIDLDENEAKSIDINIESVLSDSSTEATGIIKISNNIKEFSICKQVENVSELKCNTDTYAVCTTITKFDNNLQSSSNQLLNITKHCQYGCGYTTVSTSNLKQHYNSCLNKPYNCLFIYNKNNQLRDCEELISRKNLKEHLSSKHSSELLILNGSLSLRIGIGTLASKRYCKYLVAYGGYIFILIVQHVKPHLLLWRVEVFESPQLSKLLTFKIDMSNDNNKAELSLRASCAELTCNKNYNISDTPCIWLHWDQIKHFINNNTLSFNISVYDRNGKKITYN